ncbi:MAG: aminodeoxychorismate synthase component I [Bacteroides sp.]|nr:aminodeoxychorismate synthase component I [Bacteroides sp.]
MKLQRYSREDSISLMNRFGRSGSPFMFLISFTGEGNIVVPMNEAAPGGFCLEMPGLKNHDLGELEKEAISFTKLPVDRERYKEAFFLVKDQILYGNSFLLNLTFPTRVKCSYTLEEIFRGSKAPFKLFLEDELVVFSPERFVRIEGTTITSNPMKGTIDANIPGAQGRLISDLKEDAEHNTIVDLIRNDLSIIASDVKVNRFKYIDRIRTHQGELLQMSSEISGTLPENFQSRLGSKIFSLLPAGSICGAPKKRTLEIIRSAEKYERGYYTGVFGYWDGTILDSAVAIRYIEKNENRLNFKSGGGITFQSNCDHEYDEMVNKVYVPIY